MEAVVTDLSVTVPSPGGDPRTVSIVVQMRKFLVFLSALVMLGGTLTLATSSTSADSGGAMGSPAEPAAAVIAAGRGFHCWVASGAVRCIGGNSSGQLGDGTTTSSQTSVNVTGLSSGVVAVAAGDAHACALLLSGAVRCWGANSRGQLGNGSTVDSTTPVNVTGLSSGVARIDAGAETTCAVMSTGRLLCWGNNQTFGAGSVTTDSNADGEFDPVLVPTEVTGMGTGVLTVSVSGERTSATASITHGCAVMQYGDLMCWGSNSDGQLGTAAVGSVSTPALVAVSERVTAVSAAAKHTCALSESGAVSCWGANGNGQLATGNTNAVALGTIVSVAAASTGIVQVSTGRYTTCALSSVGGVLCWGDNIHGTLEVTPTRTSVTTPIVPHSLSSGVSALALSEFSVCALFTNGNLRCWGANGNGQTGDGYRVRTISPMSVHSGPGNSAPLTGMQEIGSSQWSTCGVTATGALRCWGYNFYGELGVAQQANRPQPVDHASLTSGVVAVDGRSYGMCALLTNTQVHCWGQNASGQLGLGDSTATHTARPMLTAAPSTAVTGVTDFSVAQFHTCVVAGGAAMCAGRNTVGSLGDGTSTASNVLVQVSGLGSGVARISAGVNNFSCAVLNDGTGRCWGNDGNGQLGNGQFASTSSTPTVVSGLSNAVDVVTGDDFACALISDGTVSCWGSNFFGQLGNGTNTSSQTPVQVSGLSGATRLFASNRNVCALVANGGVSCWGWNAHGVFANGTTNNSNVPVTLTGVTGATAFSMGSTHSCGVFASGAVMCWGSEQVGQLGNDRMENRPYMAHLNLATGITPASGLTTRLLLAPTTTTSTTVPAPTTTTVPASTPTTVPATVSSTGRFDSRVYSTPPARIGQLSMVRIMSMASLRTLTIRSTTPGTCIAAGTVVVTVGVGDCEVLIRSLANREVLRRWRTSVVASTGAVGSQVRVAPIVQFARSSRIPRARDLNDALDAASGARSVMVVGHSALLTGNTPENRVLSAKRADRVAALLRKDARAGEVVSVAIGADAPVTRALTESMQSRNRRVTVYFVP